MGASVQRIVVIGSRSLLRSGLVSLLDMIGFKPIEEADELDAIKDRMDTRALADTIIVYLTRGSGDVVRSLDELKDWAPAAKVVLLAPKLDVELLSASFASGAFGYLLESISRDALAESLRLVDAGEKVFPSELASFFPVLTANLDGGNGTAASAGTDLSRREIEILQCLSNGQSNKVIAKTLDIAEATVKVHVKRILRKAHVQNRTQAALWGVAVGFTRAPGVDVRTKRSS